jgi:hypothetical protein
MVNEPNRQWTTVTGKEVQYTSASYEFDSGGRFPVDRLDLRLPERNTLIEARIKSRAHENAPWRTRYQGVFYSLQVNGAMLNNDTVHLAVTSDRYWRIDVEPQSGGLGKGLPVLRLAWVPDTLLFVARGHSPFTLAFGSVRAETSGDSGDFLFGAVHDLFGEGIIKKARLGSEISAGGEEMLVSPKPPLPWKRWLLWFVLVSGVFLLGWMAWRLYRQMNPSDLSSIS